MADGEELEGDEGKEEKKSDRCQPVKRLENKFLLASYKQQFTRTREREYNPHGKFPDIAEEHREWSDLILFNPHQLHVGSL